MLTMRLCVRRCMADSTTSTSPSEASVILQKLLTKGSESSWQQALDLPEARSGSLPGLSRRRGHVSEVAQ